MKNTGIIKIERDLAFDLERLCTIKNVCIETNGLIFDEEFTFPDGKRMAIQVYSDYNDDNAWAQGVLYDENGCEISTTDVKDVFIGKYVIKDEGDIYSVKIVASE